MKLFRLRNQLRSSQWPHTNPLELRRRSTSHLASLGWPRVLVSIVTCCICGCRARVERRATGCIKQLEQVVRKRFADVAANALCLQIVHPEKGLVTSANTPRPTNRCGIERRALMGRIRQYNATPHTQNHTGERRVTYRPASSNTKYGSKLCRRKSCAIPTVLLSTSAKYSGSVSSITLRATQNT